jgi:hypothetical protein
MKYFTELEAKVLLRKAVNLTNKTAYLNIYLNVVNSRLIYLNNCTIMIKLRYEIVVFGINDGSGNN